MPVDARVGTDALPRPTLRAAIPFFVVGSLGLASVFFRPYASGWNIEATFMVGSAVVAACLLMVGLRRSKRTWIDGVPVMLFFVVLAAARDLSGGTASGLGPLVALPLLWLALTGTFRELLLASGLTVVMFCAPIYLVGTPEYLVSDWRRAIAWGAFGVFVAPTIQRLVRQLATETAKERSVRAELDGIMRGARLTSMIATDRDGLITSFGVGSTELLGYRAVEMVGRHRLDEFHDQEEVRAVADEIGVDPNFAVFKELAQRSSPSRIWTYLCADGRRAFVRLAMTELHDADGVLTGYLSVAIDNTAGVQAERSLALSEERWRVLANRLPDTTLIVVDEDVRIRLISGAGAMRQGLEGAEGRLFAEISNAANMALWNPLIADAFLGHESTAEMPSSKSGAEHEIVVTPLPAEADGPRALILARDVSRDRARSRELTRAKERAERLFAEAPHGVAILNRSGVVVQINQAMSSIIGPISGGIVGRRLADLSRDGDDRIDRHLVEVLASRNLSAGIDWTLLNADGAEIHVVLSSRALVEPGISEDTVMVNVVDVSDRHRFEQRLAHLADHDVLTGLVNRRKFDAELTRHLEHGERYGAKGALLVLDLDHFKDVNDTLGHGAGDELIVSTAALLSNGLRSTDIVARLGGDEFAILLTDADLAGAEVVAASIVDRVREYTATLDGNRRRVTASVGVVEIGPDSDQATDLLALADLTMYDAKDAGRDQYVLLEASPGHQTRTGARLAWKTRIENAIENDAFVLHLQPILNLETGRVGSAEALLRLNDTHELVGPGRFIYIAERAGLMPTLDSWVIEHSIELLARLRTYVPDFRIAVNLSGLSIGDATIEEVIVESLRKYEVAPCALILEITETAAVADVEMARKFAERMTSLGCQFALDDFGAGFGSFYYLKHLMFDYVKIDGEFVANCHRSAVDRAILRSIVGVTHDLGKKAVAEFVESAEILDVVRQVGVDLAQGYLFGKPMSFDDFIAGPLSEPSYGAV